MSTCESGSTPVFTYVYILLPSSCCANVSFIHFVLLSLSTEPGKGKEERAAPQDSLHTEVKSECI